jgi:hypothetical protein
MRAIFVLWTGRETHAPHAWFGCHISGLFVPNRVVWVNFSDSSQLAGYGPSHAEQRAMTKIAYSESESGNVVRTAIVPANRSEEPRFGPLDRTVIVVILCCFLLCVAGLIYPLTH